MRNTTLAAVASLAAVLALAAPGSPGVSGIPGKVTRVIDGQTVLLAEAGGRLVQVSLAGIEAPLLCQNWGPEARQALKEWVLDKQVVVAAASRAEAGRLSGELMLAGDSVNRRMVEEGHAWSVRIKWDQGPYVKQERMAHALTRGLHGVAGAMPPQKFVRAHGPCVPGA